MEVLESLERLDMISLVRRMCARERLFGVGFYADEEWSECYKRLAEIAGTRTGYHDDADTNSWEARHGL